MMTRKITLTLVAFILFLPVFTYADDYPSGKPFQALKQQIDALKGEIDALKGELAEGFVADPRTSWGFVYVTDDICTDIAIYPNLPKGKYVASASAVISSQVWELGVVHEVHCFFKIGKVILGTQATGLLDNTYIQSTSITLPLTTGFTIDEAQDLSVCCMRSSGPAVVTSQPSTITAVRVNKLQVEEYFPPEP